MRREILFLADSLGANEALCAAYVHVGVDGKRWSGDGAEAGLELYLLERESMLRCLQALWRGTLSSDEQFERSGLKALFSHETQEFAVRRGADVVVDPETRTKGTWASKIIHTIDKLGELAESLRKSLGSPTASTALTAKYGGSFGEQTTQRRLELHLEERHGLGQLLFLMAAATQLTLTDTVQLTKQLARTPATDSAAVYMLVALLAAIDALDPEGEYLERSLPANGHFVNTMKAQLVDETWTVPHLQSAALLQWTVFLDRAAAANVKFQLDHTAHSTPAENLGTSAIIDALTDKAIQSGVFAFLGRGVLAFKRDRTLDDGWSDVGLTVPVLGGELGVSAAAQDWVTETVELLVLEIVTTRTRVLTRLRQREEDILPNSHRGGGHRQSQAGINDGPQARGHHLEALFLLIATLYRDAPEGGLRFWAEDDQARGAGTKSALGFLVWGSECTIPVMVRAFYEMLCSLATGPRAAAYAFQFVADGGTGNPRAAVNAGLNWSMLFRALDYYQRQLDQEPDSETGPPQMPVEEVPLMRAFVRLLRQVVQYSDSAREALYDGQGFKPVATTLALLAKFLPIDLKADLLAAVAAFARPGGSLGVTIARKTWLELEQSQVLLINPYVDPRTGALALAKSRSPLNRDGGLLAELEEVEAHGHVYPESTAFIELLNSLIHLPAPLEPLRHGIDFDSQTIPDTLGAPGREPGIDPYVSFVVDEVLLKTGEREYQDATDRWKITNM